MNLAIYARVSKPPRGAHVDQRNHDQNPEVQLHSIREWGRQQHKIVVEYVDRLTGKHANRPQLRRMMKELAAGVYDVDAVVVWRLDRFGRSVQDLYNLVAELKGVGVGFISQMDGFDLTTPIGKAMFGMLAVFAEFERNVISERTKAGLAFARSEGRRPGPKIDPRKGPSRWTIRRRRNRGEAA